jgi:cytoskeletal protein RodZ
MDNQRLNSELRDKLHDLESPFNERVSFEAVMKKRERKKRRAILWIPSMVVVAGLFVVGGLGMLWVNTDQAPEKAPQTTFSKSVSKPKFAQKGIVDKTQTLTLGAASASPEIASSERKRTSSSRIVTPLKIETASPRFVVPEIASPVMPESIERGAKAESPVSIGVRIAESPLNNEVNVPAYAHQDMLCDPQGLESVSLGIADPSKTHFEIPEGEYEAQWDPARLQSKWYVEMSATTGSRVVINFNEDDRLSILGNMYHANYHALLLKDVGSGVMLGGGLSYGEMIGTGEWRIREFQERMNIDSYDLVVMIPPVQTVRVYDTTFSQVRVVTTGELAYRIDKFSIPLAARYHFMLGKMSWRVAAQLNPGMTVKTSGDFFSNTEYAPIQSQRMLTMDAKLSVGPTISIYKDWLLVLEPNMMHHTFRDQKSGKTNGKTLTGFGVSVLHNF